MIKKILGVSVEIDDKAIDELSENGIDILKEIKQGIAGSLTVEEQLELLFPTNKKTWRNR